MYEEGRLHAGVTEEIRTPMGKRTITVNLSGVPATASRDYIDQAIAGNGAYMVDRLLQMVQQRLTDQVRQAPIEIDLSALHEQPATEEPSTEEPTAEELPDVRACHACGESDTTLCARGGRMLCIACIRAEQEPAPAPAPATNEPRCELCGAPTQVDEHTICADCYFSGADVSQYKRPSPMQRLGEIFGRQMLPEPACEICQSAAVVGQTKAGMHRCADHFCDDPFCDNHDDAARSLCTSCARRGIPKAADVRTGSIALGVSIDFPPDEWLDEPLTEESPTGGPGQLVAVNTALSSAGYGGAKRHPATNAILAAFGPIHGRPHTTITSIRQLSKAQAHIVLSWFEHAQPSHLAALFAAITKEQKCLL